MIKRILIIVAGALCAVVVALIAVSTLIDVDHFRPQIQAGLSQALGRPVRVGQLHLAIWRGSLGADDIRIDDAPAFGKTAFVSAKSLNLGLKLWPLIAHQRVEITSLTLDRPSVALRQAANGRWNFASLATNDTATTPPGTGAAAVALHIDRLRIHDGDVRVIRAGSKPHVYRNLELKASDIGVHTAFPFTLHAALAGHGQLELEGRFGPLHSADATLTPFTATLKITGLDPVGAGLVPPGAGLSGVFGFDGQLASRNGVLESHGRIDAQHVQLVATGKPAQQPLRVQYATRYRIATGNGTVNDTQVDSGTARVSIKGTYVNRAGAIHLNLDVSGHQLPVDALTPLLPAFGVVLPAGSSLDGGNLTAAFSIGGNAASPTISGPVTLSNTTLTGYSLGARLGSVLALAGIHAPKDTVIKQASTRLDIRAARLDAHDIKADIAELGTLTGQATMAADGKLDGHLLIKLNSDVVKPASGANGMLGNSSLGKALGGALGESADQGIGVSLGGTASDPSFKPDAKSVAGILAAGLNGGADKNKNGAGTDNSQAAGKKDGNPIESLLRNALKKKSNHDNNDGQHQDHQ